MPMLPPVSDLDTLVAKTRQQREDAAQMIIDIFSELSNPSELAVANAHADGSRQCSVKVSRSDITGRLSRNHRDLYDAYNQRHLAPLHLQAALSNLVKNLGYEVEVRQFNPDVRTDEYEYLVTYKW